jgi:ribose 5-phosphate isomerase A
MSESEVKPTVDPEAADDQKRRAAQAAVETYIRSGMTIGLGSGSTAAHFIHLLGQAIARGELSDVRCIATSLPSDRLARESNVPLVHAIDSAGCDVVVDGADEVDPQLNLVKGLGGALVREKIVAQSSALRVIITDESKTVQRLGTRSPLPVEILRWAHNWEAAYLADRTGGRPVLRTTHDGYPFVTDNGNLVYDVHLDPAVGIDDAYKLEADLLRRGGIVQTGLFLDLANVVIVASPSGVEHRKSATI